MKKRIGKLRRDIARFKRFYEYTQERLYRPREKRRLGAITVGDIIRNSQDLIKFSRRANRWRRRAESWMKPKG